MTVIAACVSDNGTMFIAADRMETCGNLIRNVGYPKIFMRDHILIGCAGDARMQPFWMYKFKAPTRKDKQTDDEYIMTTYADKLFDRLENEDIDTEEIGGLVVFNGNIYRLTANPMLDRSAGRFSAAGIGESYALGALEAILGDVCSEDDALHAVKVAVEVASRCCAGCGGGVDVLRLAKHRGVST